MWPLGGHDMTWLIFNYLFVTDLTTWDLEARDVTATTTHPHDLLVFSLYLNTTNPILGFIISLQPPFHLRKTLTQIPLKILGLLGTFIGLKKKKRRRRRCSSDEAWKKHHHHDLILFLEICKCPGHKFYCLKWLDLGCCTMFFVFVKAWMEALLKVANIMYSKGPWSMIMVQI